MLSMSLRERDRLVVLNQVLDGLLDVPAAAERLHLSARHVRRLLSGLASEGDHALVHGSRGRPSNHRKPAALRARVLERASDPLFHDFAPTLLAEHLSRDPEIGPLNPHTLRRWLLEAGVWSTKRRSRTHRRRRERRAAVGELVQMDTSIHPWLEGRSSEKLVLIALLDDATSRLFARFFPRDTGAANRQMLVDYISRFGRMGALYTDRAAHFRPNWHTRKAAQEERAEAVSVIRRALDGLGVELILALSPQAKGRIERAFGTLQDRLLKELRLAGVATIEEANRFLEEEFIPCCWTPRFTVPPSSPVDAHRPLPQDVELQRVFAEEIERSIGNDFVFRFKNEYFQIEAAEADPLMPGSTLTIELRLDGCRRFRWKDRYLEPTRLGKIKPAAPAVSVTPKPRPRPKHAGQPNAPDHPWGQRSRKFGRLEPKRLAAQQPTPPVPRPLGPRDFEPLLAHTRP